MDVKLFAWDNIPWNEIAFPANVRGLQFFKQNNGMNSDKVDVFTFQDENKL